MHAPYLVGHVYMTQKLTCMISPSPVCTVVSSWQSRRGWDISHGAVWLYSTHSLPSFFSSTAPPPLTVSSPRTLLAAMNLRQWCQYSSVA
jgi:hypothetical protein